MQNIQSDFFEFHDATLNNVVSLEEKIIFRMRAYLHRKIGERFTVWTQSFDLILFGQNKGLSLHEFPIKTWDGSLNIGDQIFDNMIPFPLPTGGPVRLKWSLENREELTVHGERLELVPIGEAKYIEEFPED
jgi:hypothetical protein